MDKLKMIESLNKVQMQDALRAHGKEVDDKLTKKELTALLMGLEGVPVVVTQEAIDEHKEMDPPLKLGEIVIMPEIVNGGAGEPDPSADKTPVAKKEEPAVEEGTLVTKNVNYNRRKFVVGKRYALTPEELAVLKGLGAV